MFKRVITISLILIFLVAIGCLVYFVYQINRPAVRQLADTEETHFVIQKGEGVNTISRNLREADLIRSSWNFKVYVWLKGVEGKLQAGDYKIKNSIGLQEVVRILTLGEAVSSEREIKILEGWSAREIGEYLEKEEIVTKKEFLDKATNYQLPITNYDFLKDKSPEVDLEGFLFPDTYRIYKDATVEDIIKKMLNNFDVKLTPQLRQDIEKSGRSIFEIITIASIIEREVPEDEDRRIVADIFYKRLDNGWPLQADSTLTYALGISKKHYTTEDTKVDSPYNTYAHQGLPPGPIGSPGLSAIQAAIYPTKNNYWYFLSKDNGETVFSKTLEEHNINKAKYLK